MNKTSDMKKYNKEYMNSYYKQNPLKAKLTRNTNRLKQKNNFDQELCNNYKHYLASVIKISKLYDQLPEDMKNILKNEIDNFDFTNVQLKI